APNNRISETSVKEYDPYQLVNFNSFKNIIKRPNSSLDYLKTKNDPNYQDLELCTGNHVVMNTNTDGAPVVLQPAYEGSYQRWMIKALKN
ncbi:hypothetical protein BG005_000547, partial [Podila minutissima]